MTISTEIQLEKGTVIISAQSHEMALLFETSLPMPHSLPTGESQFLIAKESEPLVVICRVAVLCCAPPQDYRMRMQFRRAESHPYPSFPHSTV